MKSNKGITFTSLVIYIALIFVILAILMRITTYFSNNMQDATDVSFETEFNKLNLYLLDESKKTGNEILEITEDGTQISFSDGNKYVYNAENKTIYLDDTIKVCENIESCLFEQQIAENGKDILALTITINEVTKTVEYIMNAKEVQDNEVDIDDYLIGASRVTYYLKAGDYVDYTPDIGTYKVAAGAYGSGYSEIQSFTTETGTSALKWRVLSIDEQTGEIELISATVGQTLYLSGADGYNHGVDILNDLCENLYSKTVNGKKIAMGRSINVEDINAKTTYDYTTFYGTYKYGTIKYFTDYSIEDRKYPNLYSKEKGMLENGLGENDGLNDGVVGEDEITQYKTVSGYSNDYDENTGASINNVSAKYTYYYYSPEKMIKNLGINTLPSNSLINLGETYWLASRGLSGAAERWSFRIRFVEDSGNVGCTTLFNSYGSVISLPQAVRPVVTLDASQLLDFSIGDGSEENPWGMK